MNSYKTTYDEQTPLSRDEKFVGLFGPMRTKELPADCFPVITCTVHIAERNICTKDSSPGAHSNLAGITA